MRNVLIVLFLLVSVSAAASRVYEGYTYKDGKWYFQIGGRFTEIIGYDSLTFQIVHPTNPSVRMDLFFAKDKNYVYYKGEQIDGANPQTFELIFFSEYSKDSKNVYYETKKLDSADVETFEWIPYVFNQGYGSTGNRYAKDKNFVFRSGVIIPYDAATFQLLPWGFMIDKSGIYYRDKILKGSSSVNYRSLDTYMISNNKVYHKDIEIKGADANSFQIVKHRWIDNIGNNTADYTIAKDKNFIYIDAQPFKQFDVKTFEIVSSPILSYSYDYDREENKWIDRNAVVVKDKNGTYRIQKDLIGYSNSIVQFNIVPN